MSPLVATALLFAGVSLISFAAGVYLERRRKPEELEDAEIRADELERERDELHRENNRLRARGQQSRSYLI